LKKYLFIYNPNSGSRDVPRKLDYIIKKFEAENILIVPYRISGNDGNDEDNLDELLSAGTFSSVVVSGGDGTVAGVVNRMIKNNNCVPLGIIPAGTCNDFARSLGIPEDLKKSIDLILEGNIVDTDAGLINDTIYFLNTCAGGNFVATSYNTSNELKKNFGPLAYYIKALEEVAQIKPVRLRVTTDDEMLEGNYLFFLILNGKHAAGFKNINKEADIADGYMDILLVKDIPAIELAALFLKVIRNEFINDKNVIWLRSRNCLIEGSNDFALSLDGEKWGSLPISVKFLNKILKVYGK